MKMLTTVAAVAALVAGMSIANAANTTGPAAANPAKAGTGKYCMTTKNGPKNCSYATMASCQSAAKGMKGTCTENMQSSATGSK